MRKADIPNDCPVCKKPLAKNTVETDSMWMELDDVVAVYLCDNDCLGSKSYAVLENGEVEERN